MKTEFFKSPLNYIGNKYKLLPQIIPLFPQDIDNFVDLFCGGLDVSLNVKANQKFCNDIEGHLIDLYSNIQNIDGITADNKIVEQIEKYDLSMTNAEGYNLLRRTYNESEKNWILFYTLIAYSFNHQIRYNYKDEFNMPFGKNRSCYNKSLQGRFKIFVDRIDDSYIFYNKDFREVDLSFLSSKDFLYIDPPYLITTATYNERGGWIEKDEQDLLDLLDSESNKGIRFALSNVISQNGQVNELLEKWSKKYIVHDLSFSYSNSSYHKKDRSRIDTQEVLICNYKL